MVKNAIQRDRRADFDRAREDSAGLEGVCRNYRLEGDVVGRLGVGVGVGIGFGFCGFLEGTVDADVGILVETGVAFEAGGRIFVTAENVEIVLEKAETPFEAFERVVMFEGVRLALGLFDEFAICYAGSRPVCREVVGIEFVKAFAETRRADNDVFAALGTKCEVVHGSAECG